jgi:hypothetical protein
VFQIFRVLCDAVVQFCDAGRLPAIKDDVRSRAEPDLFDGLEKMAELHPSKTRPHRRSPRRRHPRQGSEVRAPLGMAFRLRELVRPFAFLGG